MVTHHDTVRDYYERNTRHFVRWGQGSNAGAIHRAIWGPGVRSREQAMHYVHELGLEQLRRHPDPRLVDMGCGVGGSIQYLMQRCEGTAEGITISEQQAQLATRRLAEVGLGDRCTIRRADFLESATSPGQATLCLAIEAFVHAARPAAFFERAAEHLAPGGRLMICDDFLADESQRQHTDVERFQRGWHTGPLCTREQADAHAVKAGLSAVSSSDLTPFLELGRPRDVAIRWFVRTTRAMQPSSRRWLSLDGGDALQRGLLGGQLQHLCCVWERQG